MCDMCLVWSDPKTMAEVIKSLAAIAWPAIVFYVVWAYRKQVSELFATAKTRKFTIEVGGQKLSMEEASHQQQSLISDLQKQVLDLRQKVEGVLISPHAQLTSGVQAQVSPSSNAVLWVDDNPKNNSYFIEVLQQRGYRVDTAESTADALAKIDRQRYRLVLSDMGRRESGHFNLDAGIDLLEELNRKGVAVPFVVFCSEGGVSQFRDRLQQLGGRAITSSPTELRAILDEWAPESTG